MYIRLSQQHAMVHSHQLLSSLIIISTHRTIITYVLCLSSGSIATSNRRTVYGSCTCISNSICHYWDILPCHKGAADYILIRMSSNLPIGIYCFAQFDFFDSLQCHGIPVDNTKLTWIHFFRLGACFKFDKIFLTVAALGLAEPLLVTCGRSAAHSPQDRPHHSCTRGQL